MQKEAGREIASLGGPDKAAAISRVSQLADDYKRLDAEAEELADRFHQIWATIPNLVDETAADGLTDADNQEIRRVGDATGLRFRTIGLHRGSVPASIWWTWIAVPRSRAAGSVT